MQPTLKDVKKYNFNLFQIQFELCLEGMILNIHYDWRDLTVRIKVLKKRQLLEIGNSALKLFSPLHAACGH